MTLTLGSIAIVAYILANVLHEGLGHAGACLALGCTPLSLTTAYFEGDSSAVGVGVARLVSASGSVVNLAAGAILFWLYRRMPGASGNQRYFLWLFSTVNLLGGAGYPLFSGVLGVGDWASVVNGLRPAGLWRTALVAVGVVLYAGAIWVSLSGLAGLVGSREPDTAARGVRLTVAPYLIGSVASTVGALFNPSGPAFVATSAAAHFGGTSGLAWMAQLLPGPWLTSADREPVRIIRSPTWIALALGLLILHVAVLGPGVRF